MEAFVISLEKSVERRAYISNQLESLDISYNFINAVNGTELDSNTINDFKNIRKKAYKNGIRASWDISPGVVGCALSHIKTWRHIVENLIPIALILEDDASLGSNLLKAWNRATTHEILERGNIDILQLAAVKNEFPYMPQIKWKNRTKLGNELEIGFPAKTVPGTSCYIVTLQGARKLIAAAYPLRYSSDQLMANAEYFGINLWLSKTPIGFQNRILASTIESRTRSKRRKNSAITLLKYLTSQLDMQIIAQKIGLIDYYDKSLLLMEKHLCQD